MSLLARRRAEHVGRRALQLGTRLVKNRELQTTEKSQA